MSDFPTDLFDWANSRPPETVIDFATRRERLPRWHQIRMQPLAGYDRAVARQRGQLQPAPILPFPPLHPASPGSYTPDARARG